MKLISLIKIGKVVIAVAPDHSYGRFVSDLDICNDGSGAAFNDPHYRPATAYQNGGKFLNAGVDPYIVLPMQTRKLFKKKVMGCQAKLTNLATDLSCDAMVGELGPTNKTGEAAYCLAKQVNPKVTHNSGDKR